MTGWTEEDIRRQFQRAKKNGWLQTFKNAEAKYGFPPDVLMAIASRETNMHNVVGDGGHGYGIMQIDDRNFPEWCHSGLWKDASAGIQKRLSYFRASAKPSKRARARDLMSAGTHLRERGNSARVNF